MGKSLLKKVISLSSGNKEITQNHILSDKAIVEYFAVCENLVYILC